MSNLPEPKYPIPDQLKVDNWTFHALARSDDPAVKCQNIGNLVRNVIATVTVAGVSDEEYYDETFHMRTTIGKFLYFQLRGANESWNHYTQMQPGYAVEKAGAVLNNVLAFVYDPRYTTSRKESFTARIDK